MKVDMRITTLRHAESVFSGERRYAGTKDVPLTQRGRRDAHDAAEKLHGLGIEAVISSSLKRAIVTASIIAAKLEIPHTQTPLCNERNFGALEGLTEEDLSPYRNRLRYIRAGGDFHSLNPPGGETFPQLRRRAERFSRFLEAEALGSHVLVVSHGVFLLQLHGVFKAVDWIDALEDHVSPLEYRSFEFAANRLVRCRGLCLVPNRQGSW